MLDDARQTIVLLIEDDQAAGSPCRALIESVGATCHPVASLQAAEASLGDSSPDVVVVDYNLPDGTGLDVIGLLRQHPRHRATPIILLTGEIHPAELERAVMMGIYAFLARPFSPQEFTKLVSAAIADEASRVRPDRP